ncbi:MAG: hypothetical protein GY809_33360, partial [Planctomycetes bacterium]|nr:hypothetical protein [Planctomycetota bacterium]
LAIEYAERALNYNRFNVNAHQLLVTAYRTFGMSREARRAVEKLLEIDPLSHFARFEQYLQRSSARTLKHFQSMIRNEFPKETYMELALYYVSIGQETEAVRVLEYVQDHPTACYWLAYLLRREAPDKSRQILDQAAGLSARGVFPFREETIPVLQWAMEAGPSDWKARYYLALITWSRGRAPEARELLNRCGTPDFAPLYITRAHINKETDQHKAVLDFQAAINVDPQSWRARHHLISYYNELGRVKEALVVAHRAASWFPDHIVMRIDLVRTLVKNGSWKQALDLLERTFVLPFEGAREVHGLFVACQMQLALEKIKAADYASAIEHLEGAKQYPERLGTGRPYDPDFREQDYLQALCHDKLKQADKAQAARKAVYDYTLGHLDDQGPNQYFGVLVLEHFGDHEKAGNLKYKGKSSQQILDVIQAMETAENTVPYGVGVWDANGLGNHRVVIDVPSGDRAVAVHIPWRRRDHDPHKKKAILVDAKTGNSIGNVFVVEVNREFGDFVFEPKTVPGEVYLYYLPHEMTGSHYPQVSYGSPDWTPDTAWLDQHGLTDRKLARERWAAMPRAGVVEMQSIDRFNSFYPMEVIATAAETRDLLSCASDTSYLLFPEDRAYPIRMTEDLPQRWIERGLSNQFEGQALRGEFYAFQVGVYAFGKAISDLEIDFGDLKGPGESQIDASKLRCFNIGGVDWQGREFDRACPVEQGRVRALWFGVSVPSDVQAGQYTGKITITPRGAESGDVHVALSVADEIIADAGDHEPWRHSRLRWLDSTIAMDDE